MKTITVVNYIYDTYNERGTKAFTKRVTKTLRDKGVEGYIICLSGYMERASGYGSYNYVAVIEINNDVYHLKQFTHDSVAWDELEGTKKEGRYIFENVISDYDFTDII